MKADAILEFAGILNLHQFYNVAKPVNEKVKCWLHLYLRQPLLSQTERTCFASGSNLEMLLTLKFKETSYFEVCKF